MKSQNKLQSIRGVRDILTDETPYWLYLEQVFKDLSQTYGYENIRLPILEKTELFARSIGQSTDIVEKEMYTFLDRNGDSLTLRPEGTAGVVRMAVQHGLLRGGAKRYWYHGPMFRHERPQKERFRQFDQFGLEAFGISDPSIDVELLLFCQRFWKILGISDHVVLHINSLGQPESRKVYRKELVKYLMTKEHLLDDDSKKRLSTNPLRILDSKNEDMQDLIHKAPNILEYLDQKSAASFEKVCNMLKKLDVKFIVNSKLVRGLDYYNDTVFEWITEDLGSQGTICAGGRYDGLVSSLGGAACDAIGFAIGSDRVIHLLRKVNEIDSLKKAVDIYIVSQGDIARNKAFILAEQLRNKYNRLNIITYCGSSNFKKQFKEADRNKANLALIIGDEEVKNNTVSVKYLNEKKEQKEYNMQDFDKFMATLYSQTIKEG